ncbi:MAG: T9SS type A sorting domain-containing protein [bacterium]
MKPSTRIFYIIIFIIASSIVYASVVNKSYTLYESSVSRKNLIKSSLISWEDGKIFFSARSDNFTSIDTVKILAFMAEFIQDDDSLTSGDGTFILTAAEDTIIDPPPHDKAYFEDQLSALASYYESVSGGKLILKSTVFPHIIELNHTMAHYSPDDGYSDEDNDNGTDERLVELFKDAVLSADSAGAVFSDYDCYIIFHAGVGKDIALSYDPTPRDIPSAFLNFDDFKRYLAEGDPDFQGIEVENKSFHIQEGIILPETESQEDLQYYYEVGLLGTMSIMFGFQLGLPALWNTEDGRSGIGMWGLMDQGSGNYMGLIPAEPCAFSKVLLGWEKPIVANQQDNLKIGCSKAVISNKIYKVPINDHEYFLIENRQYDTNGDSITTGKTSTGAQVIFRPDGTVEMEEAGVITSVEEYDYGLPGSGILIWHIDEQVIRATIEENRINANKDHRGVDLEEADGAQDIGELYSYTSGGSGSEYGVLHDAWFQDNEINQLVNDTNKVMFTPYSFPSSRSNQGGNSHIVITDFSPRDTVMSFSVTTDLLQSGFPCYFESCSTWISPVLSGDLDADGNQELIIASGKSVYAWKTDGTPFYSDSTGFRVSVASDTLFYDIPLLFRCSEQISIPPLVYDINGDNQDEVLTADQSGTVSCWRFGYDNTGKLISNNLFSWNDGQYSVSTYLHIIVSTSDTCLVFGTHEGKVFSLSRTGTVSWGFQAGEEAVTGICQVSDKGSIAITCSNTLFFVDNTGSLKGEKQFSETLHQPISAYLGEQDYPHTAVVSSSGELLMYDRFLDICYSTQKKITHTDISMPTAGDIDGDGISEIIITAQDKIYGFNSNASFADYSPFPYYPRSAELSSCLLGDINGDGKVEMVVSTSHGNIEAWDYSGEMVAGFPLTTGCSLSVPPTLLDVDRDGDIEIVAVSERGFLYVWDLSGSYSDESIEWGSYLYDAANSGMSRKQSEEIPEISDIMPVSLVYNYPNPVKGNFTYIRYRLEKQAEVKIEIYNLAGELVESFSAPGMGNKENEIIWNVNEVESGVYFCRVHADTGSEEKAVICKIAVVK